MANTKNLNLTQVRRISLLLAYLKRNPYQNKQAILDYFEDNDKGFNERTLYRLNETLSRDFGIEIVFDYNNDGYYFDEEKSVNPEAFLSLLEILVTAELFSTNFKEKNSALSFVEFENKAAIETLPNFKTILNAIQQNLPITFKHYSFYLKLIVAVIPALLFGALLKKYIDAALNNLWVIAIVMIAGGVILLFIDKLFKANETATNTNNDASEISYQKSFIIGCFQVLSIVFPGLSRSAATIIGGMSQKLSKKIALEFSFFLAVPTMMAASAKSTLDVYKTNPEVFATENLITLLIGAIGTK